MTHDFNKQISADVKVAAMSYAYMAALLATIGVCVWSVAYFANSTLGLLSLALLFAWPDLKVNLGAPPERNQCADPNCVPCALAARRDSILGDAP